MKKRSWLRGLSSLFLMMSITFSVIQPGLAASVLAQPVDGNTVYDPLTGALAFVGTEPGKATVSRLADAANVSPTSNAAAFASAYASQMGLQDVSADLTLTKAVKETSGRSTVRYQQTYQGIPVFGGEVIVNTDAHGAMLSLTAKTSPNLQANITPTLTADDAVTSAIQAISKYNDLATTSLTASAPKLQIYDSRLLNPDGIPPRLVWNTVISALADGINEVVLVDAHNGAIVLHYNQIDFVAAASSPAANTSEFAPGVLGSPKIGVYNLNHATPSTDSLKGWPGTLICNQTTSTKCNGDTDAANAYLNARDAYNFLKTYLGIDSIDNAGATINSSIHYGTGYKKTFWITSLHIAVYGDGYTKADDMAGHAIAFGLTETTANMGASLVLQYQPGAIAESLADMWGEFIDQTNGRGTDTAAVKWIIGEDWPLGPQRNMKNPSVASFRHPDKMTSPYFYLGDDNSIGIYKNAGVNNKAVYLMTDGGTFNGKTVTGLGIAKVAHIYYEAETHLLASASTYFDLYYAVKQACYNVIGSYGILAQDCDQVRNALDAVQMNLPASSTVYPVANYCPTGKSKGAPTLFFDSLESGTAKWTLTNLSNVTQRWAPVKDRAANGLYHFGGPEPARVSLATAQITSPILIPTGYPVFLYFEHWFNFEAVGGNYYDGGVLQYSLNNGLNWVSAAPLYTSGQKYNGTLATGRGNPLAGQSAFVFQVRNYVSSSFNLTSLAGKKVMLRWIVASDNSGSGLGWYVDNIQVYRCLSLPGIPVPVAPANNALVTNYKPTLDWSNSSPDLDHYMLQVSTNTTFTALVYQGPIAASIYTLTKNLNPNAKYYWRVRAYNQANDALAWSAVRSFRTAMTAPILQSPIGTSPNVKPAYNWSDVPGAQGYTIQVSRLSTFASLVVNVTITKPTSAYLSTTPLLHKVRYYWRVRANGLNGPSLWGVTKTFVTP